MPPSSKNILMVEPNQDVVIAFVRFLAKQNYIPGLDFHRAKISACRAAREMTAMQMACGHHLYITTSRDQALAAAQNYPIALAAINHRAQNGYTTEHVVESLLMQEPVPVILLLGQDSIEQRQYIAKQCADLDSSYNCANIIQTGKKLRTILTYISSVLGTPTPCLPAIRPSFPMSVRPRFLAKG